VRTSRIDLLLTGDVLCEVKSVGAEKDGVALFPDAPTERGVRHLALLSSLARRGLPTALVFCAQRGDVTAVSPDRDIDPAFAGALKRAAKAGVRLVALRASAHPEGMRLHGEIPVVLS
jgi:sugar fermentation stimulation protein A